MTNDVDRGILRMLLAFQSPTQEEIADTLKADRGAVVRSLCKLVDLGLVELPKGRTKIPRLCVFDKLQQLEESIASLREAVA
jgi:predicted transcriptional regulator